MPVGLVGQPADRPAGQPVERLRNGPSAGWSVELASRLAGQLAGCLSIRPVGLPAKQRARTDTHRPPNKQTARRRHTDKQTQR